MNTSLLSVTLQEFLGDHGACAETTEDTEFGAAVSMGWGFQFSFSSNELAHHSEVCTQKHLAMPPAKIPIERWGSGKRTLWGLCYIGTWL